MAKINTVIVNNRLMQLITIHVKITTPFKIKAWIGKQLIRLAVWVMGAKVEFEQNKPEENNAKTP